MSLLCKHVYTYTGKPICSSCGSITHDIDWGSQINLNKEWKITNPKVKHSGWWSI